MLSAGINSTKEMSFIGSGPEYDRLAQPGPVSRAGVQNGLSVSSPEFRLALPVAAFDFDGRLALAGLLEERVAFVCGSRVSTFEMTSCPLSGVNLNEKWR